MALAITSPGAHAQKAWELYGKVNGMVGDQVISMDVSGSTVWVGTVYVDPDPEAPLQGGVSLLDPSTGNFTTYTPNEGLAFVKVWDILIDGDKIWFGTPRGLCVLDTKKLAQLDPFDVKQAFTTYTPADGLVAEDVKCLAKSGNVLWFGTNDGLGSLDTSSMTWSQWHVEDGLPAKGIESLGIDGKILWVGTTDGLSKFDTEKGTFETIDIPVEDTKVVNCIVVREGSVWVGTREGLHVLDQASGKWTSYGEDDLPDVWVSSFGFKDDEAWVGTREGVAVIKGRKSKVINEKKGLASNDVQAVEPVGDYIWIGTAKGLNRYYPGAAAAQMRQMTLIIGAIVAGVAVAVVAKVKFFKPTPEELEKRKQAEEIRTKRKERKRAENPPWQMCKGVPSKELCGRCKYNSVKSGKLHCSKYDIDLESSTG